MERPVIAVTMGDPSGIGPEIIAAALADPSVTRLCRPLVLGDRGALERGVAVTGLPLSVETVLDTGPLKTQPGVLYLRELSADVGFEVVKLHRQPVRQEQRHAIEGLYVYLTRR